MTDERKRPGAAFFVTVFLVAAVLLYPATFGPTVWLAARDHIDQRKAEQVYWPVLWLAVHGPRAVSEGINWWGALGLSSDEGVLFFFPVPNGEYALVFARQEE